MPKHCWVCNKTEEFFRNQKKELLDSIEKQIEECNDIEKNIIRTTAEKLGFSEESKKLAKNIKEPYTTMTLSAVLENKENFLQLEPALKVVLDYCEKYYDARKDSKTIADVIEKYLQEPIQQRYSNELRGNKFKLDSLTSRKNEIEKIHTFFIEKEITDRTLELSNLGFKFSHKFLICPICASLFEEAASASFDILEAKRKANEEAMDWDDDDDEDL